MTDVALETMVRKTVALLEAVANANVDEALACARQVRKLAWRNALPAIASAAGAFEESVSRGATSEDEMKRTLQWLAHEVQVAVRAADDSGH